MFSDVGHGIQPLPHLLLGLVQAGDLPQGPKVGADVFDSYNFV